MSISQVNAALPEFPDYCDIQTVQEVLGYADAPQPGITPERSRELATR